MNVVVVVDSIGNNNDGSDSILTVSNGEFRLRVRVDQFKAVTGIDVSPDKVNGDRVVLDIYPMKFNVLKTKCSKTIRYIGG